MIDQSTVSWMIDAFDARYPLDQARVMLMDVLDELGLGVGWPCDQHRTSVADRLCNVMQKVLIFGRMAAPDRIGLVMEMVSWVVRMNDEPLDVFTIEVKHTSLMMIDPDNRVIMA
jgi:hypothetical protein